MAFNSKVGSFQVTTGAVASTQAITGVGFQPVIVLFWSTARTETSDAIGRQTQSSMFGFAISTSKRGVLSNMDTDNSAFSNANFIQGQRNDACIGHIVGSSAYTGALDLSSMDSDGFTLKVGIQYSTAYTVHYLALGGNEVQADGGFVTPPTTSIALTVSSMSFQPNVLILGYTGGTTMPGTLQGGSNLMLSLSTGSAAGQQAIAKSTWFNTTPVTRAQSYGSTGACFVHGGTLGGAVTSKAVFTSFNSNGWTITFGPNALGASQQLMWVGIQLGRAIVGSTNTLNSTGSLPVTGVGFQPKAVLLLSHCLAQSSGTTTQLGGARSIGAFTSSSNRGAEAAQVQDTNGSNSNVGSAVEFDKVYANISSTNTIQGALDATSLDSDGFTLNQTTGDPQANFLGFLAMGSAPIIDKSYNADVYVLEFRVQHNVDVYVQGLLSKSHNVDVHVQVPQVVSAINVAGQILFKISPNAYIKVAGTVLQPSRQFINVLGTIVSKANFGFLNVAGRIQTPARNFIKVAGTISNDKLKSFGADVSVAQQNNVNFVKVAGTIVARVAKGACGGFPDAIYIKVAGWIVNPTNDSIQMPGAGYTKTDDWLSSQDAVAAYKPGSRFTIFGSTLPGAGISLAVTAFTAGVISNQTRTRTWLRRVDAAPNGILITQEVSTHTLPNGAVVTTTIQKQQQQDTLITTTTIQNSATPSRISTIISEKSSSGQTTTREIDTNTVNGIINSLEKKTVTTKPPVKDNIQPLQVRTLDGVIHYQFFDQINTEWAGGEQEGLTTTNKQVQIVPGTLNGSTTDAFGNLIYNQITDETVASPTGKVETIHTEEIGTRKDVGTITTDTDKKFNGVKTTTTKTTNYPDGSKTVSVVVTDSITGDSVETTAETVTDEFGQVTVTVTQIETKIFVDPVTGQTRETTTKTVTVTKGGVSTTDTNVTTNNDFEDDIINRKIKVYSIQEFTITCVIDEFSMEALAEVNMTHQRNYALLELFGQQLGNANLSFGLRQKLIQQFDKANACLAPVVLQALGRQYSVVFAQSASAFREKYIIGTEPHVYELQMILQARSDLVNGTFGA